MLRAAVALLAVSAEVPLARAADEPSLKQLAPRGLLIGVAFNQDQGDGNAVMAEERPRRPLRVASGSVARMNTS
jgi:hypothetical protein